MAVPEFFGAIERSGLSTWIRESPSLFAFYFILLLHTVGLSLVVGANVVVDLRTLEGRTGVLSLIVEGEGAGRARVAWARPRLLAYARLAAPLATLAAGEPRAGLLRDRHPGADATTGDRP